MSIDPLQLIASLIRLGTITEVDASAGRCRVESGGITTGWLPWLVQRAGDVRTWSCPSVGEQVVLLAAGGDLGNAVVLPALYSAQAAAPSVDPEARTVVFPDGAVIEYHAGRHALTALLPAGGTAEITANAGITINGPVSINGTVAIVGDTTVQGTVVSDTDVVADGISLKTHLHGNVQAGSAKTGVPE